MVSQGADTDNIVVEVGHDVPSGGGEIGEEGVAGGGKVVGCAAGSADDDLERVGVDISAEHLWRKVETAGAGVCNCCVCRWYGRGFGGWWDWDTVSSRKNNSVC